MKRAALLALIPCLAAPAAASDATWAAMARNDLRALHDLLRDNHPGPVDPENGRYREWLEAGLHESLRRARAARSWSDYARALRFYTNGFQDGHVGIGLEISPEEMEWPGFVVGAAASGAAEVLRAEADAGVQAGDLATACDGRSVDALMKQRVDPFYWNTAIPHDRGRHVQRLFERDAGDSFPRLRSCAFSSGEVALKWRRIPREDLQRAVEASQGVAAHDPSLRAVDGLWWVSLPTLAYSGEARVARIRGVIAELVARAAELRRSTVVLDVRGNHGGDSAWGKEVAAALWGRDWVERVDGSFDGTVDWRASAANIAHMIRMVERQTKAGLTASAADCGRVVEAMKAARAQHRPLARVEDRPRPAAFPPPENPITGRVFFLTDNVCASACLDFADLVRRLPRVTHVGLPTSADAIYIDNTYALLPSGAAGLGYSLKVYRNRVRGNNEWYEPEVRWPGGPMTDAALAKWIASLR